MDIVSENFKADLFPVFAPCALGGVINDRTLAQLKVEIVAGAANNQLLEVRHGEALAERGMLYAPDYMANAGGVINVCIGALCWERERVTSKVRDIRHAPQRLQDRGEGRNPDQQGGRSISRATAGNRD